MACHKVEFIVAKGHVLGIRNMPLNDGAQCARHLDHPGIVIQANDTVVGSEAVRKPSRHCTGTTADIERRDPRRRAHKFDERVRPWTEHRGHQVPFIDFCRRTGKWNLTL